MTDIDKADNPELETLRKTLHRATLLYPHCAQRQATIAGGDRLALITLAWELNDRLPLSRKINHPLLAEDCNIFYNPKARRWVLEIELDRGWVNMLTSADCESAVKHYDEHHKH